MIDQNRKHNLCKQLTCPTFLFTLFILMRHKANIFIQLQGEKGKSVVQSEDNPATSYCQTDGQTDKANYSIKKNSLVTIFVLLQSMGKADVSQLVLFVLDYDML